ncbi:MAG: BON domain-containing protein [Proteobacteria bacterium]|nr:BON domain-containing protein [Pseudomonadota bacterium]MDA1021777.1 BON domain-containing protein [Pseudomonadota bacterium]
MKASLAGLFRLRNVGLLLGLLTITGCAGAVIGGGAAVGTAAYQERGVRGVARDIATATRIRTGLINAGEKYVSGVGVEVYEGRALLTGVLADEATRAQAVGLVWKVEGVKDVLNEIQIGASSLRDLAKDSWVTTQLKTKLTFDREILAINYSMETVNGIVYLIGIAQNQKELDRVIAHARDIDYVRNIISHVRVKKGRS